MAVDMPHQPLLIVPVSIVTQAQQKMLDLPGADIQPLLLLPVTPALNAAQHQRGGYHHHHQQLQ